MFRVCALALALVIVAFRSATADSTASAAGVGHFSQAETLKRIFPTYDPTQGTIAEPQIGHGALADVAWNEGRPWSVNGQHFFVVLIDVAVRESSHGFCGVCAKSAYLAVLEERNGKLGVLASAPLHEFSGHRNLSLDLAPYHLDHDETLIGVRTDHIWIPVHELDASLELYRIVGTGLQRVFRTVISDHRYPDGINAPMIEQRTSSVGMEPSWRGSRYNDITVRDSYVRCKQNLERAQDPPRWLATTYSCGPIQQSGEPIWSGGSNWRFDGTRYVEDYEFHDWGN